MLNSTATIASKLVVNKKATVKNRLFKSAMSEQLADKQNAPTEELIRLYSTWAAGGTGLLVTGNVMVDRNALGEPRNVVLDERSDLSIFKRWAEVGSANDTHVWMQLNHPGKQVPSFMSKEPVAPSALPLGNGLEAGFKCPRALSDAEIRKLIERFAWVSATAKACGFSGVQIHSAHGYLVSQFLSPHHNRREDQWGGSLENRMRFLLEIYRAIRATVGDSFPISVKLNSADFQKGGFDETDSIEVIKALQNEGIDLIEISGGNYENPSMVGEGVKESTLKREAYFLEYAEKAQAIMTVPLVVTGGFRSAAAMNSALQSGAADMIGLGRPLALDTSLAAKLIANEKHAMQLPTLSTGIKLLDTMAMLEITWYEQQLARIGKGKLPKPNLSEWISVLKTFGAIGAQAFQTRRV